MKDILILHGWGSCAKNWSRVKNYLEERGFKVYVPDLPGFGENPPPQEVWSIDHYAEWARTYCENQNLSPVFLLGHSFGGSIAAKFALKYPEKIKKMFLVAPALVRVKTLKKKIINKTAKFFSFLPSSAKNVIYGRVLKSDYPLSAGIMRDIFQKVVAHDLSSQLSKIKVPTIIIWGAKDDVTPIKDAHLIRQKIKNSTLEILPPASHRVNLEFPEKLAEVVLKYLK
jgi:pimeloyl-ACP methyl ester carboxylesterase